MIGHMIDIEKVKLMKAPFLNIVVIKSPYLLYRLQRLQVLWCN